MGKMGQGLGVRRVPTLPLEATAGTQRVARTFSTTLRRWLAISITLATAGITAPAWADNAAAANALFDEGKRLMQAGRFAEACTKFADSQKLDPGVGTMLNLAACYEKNNQSASAWSTYRAAAAAARDKGQTAREQAARDAVTRLEPTLAKVIVTVTPQPGADALNVALDGVPIPPGLRGLPTPVDTGTHRLEASGTGKKAWSTSFVVAAQATTPMLVPALDAAPVQAQNEASKKDTPGQPPAATASDGKSQRTVAVIVAGVGVVGIGVGSVFGLMAKSSDSKSADFCSASDHCDDEGKSFRDTAFAQATISTVAFSIGGAGLLGGAILWLTAPKAQESTATRATTSASVGPVPFTVVPTVSPGGAGVFARGSF